MSVVRLRLVAVSLCMGLILAACGGKPAGGGDAGTGNKTGGAADNKTGKFETVRVMYGTDLYSLALHVGIEKGFFAEEGLSVNPTVLPFGNLGLQALVGGNTDFAVTAGIRFVNAVQQKFPVKAVALTSRGYGGMLLVPTKDTTSKTIEQLKGKKLALQKGTGITAVFTNFLNAKGLSFADFKLIDMKNVDIPAALERGDLDAALVWEPQSSIAVDKKLARVMLSYDDIAGPAKATFSYPILTSDKLIKERPDTVQRFVNAWAKSLYYIEANRDEATAIQKIAFANQGLELPNEVMKAAMTSAHYGQVVIEQADVDDIMAMADAYVRAGELTEKPSDLWPAIDGTFAKKAAQKLGKQK